jgi:tRNA-dihydrouridine synthase
MATDTQDFIRTAGYAPDYVGVFELNGGCPSPTVVGKGAGSSLLRDPREWADMVHSLADLLGPGRFAVKMRLGYESAEEFPQLLEVIRGAPLARLTVHGRTRPQRYLGHADWRPIEWAALHLEAPVVASGDVTDRVTLTDRLSSAPHVRGVLIGRGALRNPWIFSEIRDERTVLLSRETIVHALGSYILLDELRLAAPDTLIAVARGFFAEAHPPGTSEDRWRQIFAHLTQVLTGQRPRGLGSAGEWPEIPLGRHSLGRAKMLWNYLRSSLPRDAWAPEILRAKSLSDLLQGIHRVMGPEADHGVPLTYKPDLDWIYAGGKERDEGRVGSSETMG